MKKVKFVKRLEGAITPTKANEQDAGFDLYAWLDKPVSISPRETVMIDTGIAVALPKNTFGGVFARSGLGCKHGIVPSNCVGVIDNQYRDSIKVALYNHSNKSYEVNPGDRIAQLVILPFIPCELVECDGLDKTERGEGGFGSTGK